MKLEKYLVHLQDLACQSLAESNFICVFWKGRYTSLIFLFTASSFSSIHVDLAISTFTQILNSWHERVVERDESVEPPVSAVFIPVNERTRAALLLVVNP